MRSRFHRGCSGTAFAKRYRTGGQQKVTVEHVHVHSGESEPWRPGVWRAKIKGNPMQRLFPMLNSPRCGARTKRRQLSAWIRAMAPRGGLLGLGSRLRWPRAESRAAWLPSSRNTQITSGAISRARALRRSGLRPRASVNSSPAFCVFVPHAAPANPCRPGYHRQPRGVGCSADPEIDEPSKIMGISQDWHDRRACPRLRP